MKKRILLIVLCLAVAAAGTVFLIEKLKSKPEDSLMAYTAMIAARNYEEMYNRLSDDSRSTVDHDTFVSRNKNIYEGIDAQNITVQIDEITKEGRNRRLSYTISMDTVGGNVSFSCSTIFSKNKEFGWGPDWDDSMIFPDLTAEDKVRVTTSKGKRGSILDRDGSPLASDGTADSVGLVPGKITDKETTLKSMAELLQITPEDIENKLSASWVKDDSFVPVRTITAGNSTLKEQLLALPGVMITSTDARVYPQGEAFAHLTGYVQAVTAEDLEKNPDKNYTTQSVIGRTGLEALYEDTLRAEDGCEIYIADKDGKRKSNIVARPAKDGTDVKLTIDTGLQSALYDRMKQDKGCAVVIDPTNGETLALVSTPSYDPNSFVNGMTESQWQGLNEDPAMPMYNRFKAAHCPGSSFKPVTGAVGLTSGKLSAQEDMGHSGLAWQKDTSWGDYKVTTLTEYSGAANLTNALIYSDNIYFAKAALKIGADTMAQGLSSLGFGQTMPYTFGLTASSFGKDGAFSGEIDLADSGFGQGAVLVNPIHMASIYSAFVNQGSMIQPWLVYDEEPKTPYLKEQAFSPDAAQAIQDALVQVIENSGGTGHSAAISGVKLAGKTGTAEIKQSQDDQTGTELGWFNAFNLDSDTPRLAVAMIEDVKNRGGSHYVIPIVRSIFE